jgi:uncharacterized membrane protein YedE/YeeE
MANFTPVSAAIGGGLIGLSAVLLMLLTGRIAGISGIFGGLLQFQTNDRGWRIAFIGGLLLAPVIAGLIGYGMTPPKLPGNWTIIVAAGLLVGFGTRLGGGCTSGHGVCGMARLSPRSIVATLVFMATAMLVVAATHHGLARDAVSSNRHPAQGLSLLEHDLFRKPVPTFRDHALGG